MKSNSLGAGPKHHYILKRLKRLQCAVRFESQCPRGPTSVLGTHWYLHSDLENLVRTSYLKHERKCFYVWSLPFTALWLTLRSGNCVSRCPVNVRISVNITWSFWILWEDLHDNFVIKGLSPSGWVELFHVFLGIWAMITCNLDYLGIAHRKGSEDRMLRTPDGCERAWRPGQKLPVSLRKLRALHPRALASSIKNKSFKSQGNF